MPGEDLRGGDLTGIRGLLPEHLAGADLTGAKLPDEINNFRALDQVAAIAGEARKIFTGLLTACALLIGLAIRPTTDVALILNTPGPPLPIINAPSSILDFYVVGATLLAASYCYLHFYLDRLWRALATLPAVFSDGMALDERTDPWLLTNLVRAYFERLRADAPPFTLLENRVTIVMAWWLVPVTLFALWARYLPTHDIDTLTWLAFLLAATTFFGRHTFRLARATLRGEVPLAGRAPAGRRSQTLSSRVLRALPRLSGGQIIIWFLLPFLILVALSFSASTQSPRNADGSVAVFSLSAPGHALRELDPTPAKLLNFVRIRTYAELREAEVAQRPQDWDGKSWRKIKRVELRNRNLAFADATSAFLANADLRGATLTGAQLGFAQLQGANLTAAQLQDGVLWHAQLQGALLDVAQLQRANLTSANLQGAYLNAAELSSASLGRANLQGANLSGAQLQGADLRHAQLQGADLKGAQLQGAQLGNANLQGASLPEAQLQGADLRSAQLQGASLPEAQLQGADLRSAQLQGADLRGTTMWRAQVNDALWDLADLRGSTVEPMTDSEIDSLIGDATKGIPDEELRNATTEQLDGALRAEERPTRPEFPEKWQSEPNVIFETGDLEPTPLDWGTPKWATEQTYDEELAKFLGDLACGRDAPDVRARGLARRALDDQNTGRLFAQRLAARLINRDCSPARGLPDDTRRQLEQLGGLRHDAAAASPKASPPETSPPDRAE